MPPPDCNSIPETTTTFNKHLHWVGHDVLSRCIPQTPEYPHLDPHIHRHNNILSSGQTFNQFNSTKVSAFSIAAGGATKKTGEINKRTKTSFLQRHCVYDLKSLDFPPTMLLLTQKRHRVISEVGKKHLVCTNAYIMHLYVCVF